jgi:dolichyl-phosphate beta-glucosyltransferase
MYPTIVSLDVSPQISRTAKSIRSTIEKYCRSLSESKIWNTSRLLVVDDGSTDDTLGAIQSSQNRGIDVCSISLKDNEGKGSAIAKGIFEVKKQTNGGQIILIADADGSADIMYLNDLVKSLSDTIEASQMTLNPWETKSIVVGNRYDTALPSRRITRWGFKVLVKYICGDLGIDDTQCGLKLMTLDTGVILYKDLNLRRWAHDVEVLYRAKLLKTSVAEVPIGWEDKDGSKLANSFLQTVNVSLEMLFDIVWMRLNYSVHRWKPATIE